MTKPNFFIVGAPKCGTTSLASWLTTHPRIYMPPVKEPMFFNTDMQNRKIMELESYEKLFGGVLANHVAVGEASVWYMYSHDAVKNIERAYPGARYIAMIRNPVDMAYSLHQQCLFSGFETVTDFSEAWQLSPIRRMGQSIPRLCPEPKVLDYQRACSLGEQVARLKSIVGSERIHVTVLDDVARDPQGEYCGVLEFLDLGGDARTAFPVENVAKARRWQEAQILARASLRVKHQLGITRGMGILNALNRWNRRPMPRAPMPNALRSEIRTYFRQDLRLLSMTLERDFMHWVE